MNRGGEWLGQLPLVRHPAMGTKVMPSWRNFSPPADATPPAGKSGCFFLGGRSFLSGEAIDKRIADAKAAGYTDIHELNVPPPTEGTLVSSNTPTKYVWACPTDVLVGFDDPVLPTCGPGQPCYPVLTPPTVTPTPAPAPQILPFVVGMGILGIIVIAALS
jgi:hypothetical protein